MSGAKILVVVTGSIAAYKACDAISRLVQRGHQVRVVASAAALRFVGAATLEGLTGRPVLSELFAAGEALEHIELSRWADLIVVCPATANTVNRCAAGLADDLVGALLLARDPRKPLLMAPAMNPAMWAHPATAAAVARLREWGVRFIAAGTGRTACGEVGEGRLAEPEAIVTAVEAAVGKARRPLRVLVTSGPTAEPIDSVRVLTNLSSGRTGAGIASHFARCGHAVRLLRGRGSAPADENIDEQIFGSAGELDAALTRSLSGEEFDAVIHAAAVSDFAIDSIEVDGALNPPGSGKLDSGSSPVLWLRSGPKLIDSLRTRSRNPDIAIVAFKLTSGAADAETALAVDSLLKRSDADWVVHNDLSARIDQENFPAAIYGADGMVAMICLTRSDLSRALERLLADVNGPAAAKAEPEISGHTPTSGPTDAARISATVPLQSR